MVHVVAPLKKLDQVVRFVLTVFAECYFLATSHYVLQAIYHVLQVGQLLSHYNDHYDYDWYLQLVL